MDGILIVLFQLLESGLYDDRKNITVEFNELMEENNASKPSQFQELYWVEFYRLMFHARYCDLHLSHAEKIDRSINIFMAITTSSTISAWVIWNKHAYIWSIIIAFSQVINAVKQYLPYKKRHAELLSLSCKLTDVCINAEKVWLDILSGDITDDQIKKALFDVKKKKTILTQNLASTLPKNNRLYEKAESEVKQYFDATYSCLRG